MDLVHLQLLKALEANPVVTQRELAQRLGVSLGKAHYCLKALIGEGWVEARAAALPGHPRAMAYTLTAKGRVAHVRLAADCLLQKEADQATLKRQIARLRAEQGRLARRKDV